MQYCITDIDVYVCVTLSLHLSNGPLKLCVVLYVIYVGGWLGVQRIRHGRRGGGFVMVARFIIFSTSAISFIKHTHSNSLMASLTTELMKLTGHPEVQTTSQQTSYNLQNTAAALPSGVAHTLPYICILLQNISGIFCIYFP